MYTMIFITGATGHVGNNLVRLLIDKKVEFKLLQRQSGKALNDLKVDIVLGDVFDPAFLAREVKQGDIFVHVAALIDLQNTMPVESDQINNLGTKTIIDFCQNNKVKLIYTSSVDCILREKNQKLIAEPDKIIPEAFTSNYASSKAKATAYLLDKIKHEAMNAVILYPSAVIGVHDYKPSAAGIEMQKSLKRRIFFYIQGGYNFIDVTDCAKAIYACIEKSVTGNYILSGYNCTLKEFYKEICSVQNHKAIFMPLPAFFAKAFVFLIPRFSKVMVDAVLDNYHYDNRRMRQDLLENLTPFEVTVKNTISWFIQNPQQKNVYEVNPILGT